MSVTLRSASDCRRGASGGQPDARGFPLPPPLECLRIGQAGRQSSSQLPCELRRPRACRPLRRLARRPGAEASPPVRSCQNGNFSRHQKWPEGGCHGVHQTFCWRCAPPLPLVFYTPWYPWYPGGGVIKEQRIPWFEECQGGATGASGKSSEGAGRAGTPGTGGGGEGEVPWGVLAPLVEVRGRTSGGGGSGRGGRSRRV